MNKYVYHSSQVKNLKKLTPNISTHKEPWVYATTTLEMSAVFISALGGDLTCQVGRDPKTSKVYIVERFKNAFEARYSNRSGSIYLLPKDSFKSDKTGWDEEVVSEKEVKILKEIKIDDVKDFLLEKVNEGKIILVRYPNLQFGLPKDKEDLVYRGIVWSRKNKEFTMKQFREYHPDLIERIEKGLAEDKYMNEDYQY